MPNTFEHDFEARARRQTWQAKSWRFARYLSTRKVECWGFSPEPTSKTTNLGD